MKSIMRGTSLMVFVLFLSGCSASVNEGDKAASGKENQVPIEQGWNCKEKNEKTVCVFAATDAKRKTVATVNTAIAEVTEISSTALHPHFDAAMTKLGQDMATRIKPQTWKEIQNWANQNADFVPEHETTIGTWKVIVSYKGNEPRGRFLKVIANSK